MPSITTTISCQIAPEHIDLYGHLNNSQYRTYFEKSRAALQKALRLGDKTIQDMGLGLWVIHYNGTILNQVLPEDAVEIRSWFMQYTKGAVVHTKHEMYSDGKLVAEETMTHVFVDLKTGKPKRPLESLVNQIRNQ